MSNSGQSFQPKTVSQRLLDCWDAHLEGRHALLPSVEDFLTFGSLTRLEKLQRVLARVRPHHANAIRLALREKRSEKWSKQQTTKPGNPPGVRNSILQPSIKDKNLPENWRSVLKLMWRRRETEDENMLSLDNRNPPSAKVILSMASTLRVFSIECEKNGVQTELTPKTLKIWLTARHKAKNKNVSIGTRLKELGIFAIWCEVDAEMIDLIFSQRRRYAKAGSKEWKRKDLWMRANSLCLEDVWKHAEELLLQADFASPGSATRARLTIDAACLALSVVCPLRIGDLHRFEIGTHLSRHSENWGLSIKTAKTGLLYDRPRLWPELTPFLDAVLLLDMPHDDIQAALDTKNGQPIFSRDMASGVAETWPTRCWIRHFGIGEHIVRSLWHTMMFESEDDDQWIALALCGQGNGRTAQDYILKGNTKRASRRARAKLVASRKAAWANKNNGEATWRV